MTTPNANLKMRPLLAALIGYTALLASAGAHADADCSSAGDSYNAQIDNYKNQRDADGVAPEKQKLAQNMIDSLISQQGSAIRDCQNKDYSADLAAEFHADFLNHPAIYNWYNRHALIERHFVAAEELE